MKKISLLDNFTQFFDKLFPTYCIVCKKEWEGWLCKNCKKKLISHPEICPICHKPSVFGQVCLHCQLTNPSFPLKGIMILFSYNQIIKKLILALKYYHIKDTSKFLAQRMANYLLTNKNIDLSNVAISYVPTHWKRKIFQKWYNQSFQLAKNLAEILNLPLLNLCKKRTNTKSQLSLSRKERLYNLKNVFSPITSNIEQETIIIVDDLTTTWTTLKEVANCIKNINQDIEIRWLVVARHNI